MLRRQPAWVLASSKRSSGYSYSQEESTYRKINRPSRNRLCVPLAHRVFFSGKAGDKPGDLSSNIGQFVLQEEQLAFPTGH